MSLCMKLQAEKCVFIAGGGGQSLEQDWVKALSLLHMALRKTSAYTLVAVFANVCSMNKGQDAGGCPLQVSFAHHSNFMRRYYYHFVEGELRVRKLQ